MCEGISGWKCWQDRQICLLLPRQLWSYPKSGLRAWGHSLSLTRLTRLCSFKSLFDACIPWTWDSHSHLLFIISAHDRFCPGRTWDAATRLLWVWTQERVGCKPSFYWNGCGILAYWAIAFKYFLRLSLYFSCVHSKQSTARWETGILLTPSYTKTKREKHMDTLNCHGKRHWSFLTLNRNHSIGPWAGITACLRGTSTVYIYILWCLCTVYAKLVFTTKVFSSIGQPGHFHFSVERKLETQPLV